MQPEETEASLKIMTEALGYHHIVGELTPESRLVMEECEEVGEDALGPM
jgi:hypothetical protein